MHNITIIGLLEAVTAPHGVAAGHWLGGCGRQRGSSCARTAKVCIPAPRDQQPPAWERALSTSAPPSVFAWQTRDATEVPSGCREVGAVGTPPARGLGGGVREAVTVTGQAATGDRRHLTTRRRVTGRKQNETEAAASPTHVGTESRGLTDTRGHRALAPPCTRGSRAACETRRRKGSC